MNTEPKDVSRSVGRLVRAATGEEYGDGMLVTDVIHGYAEPGYGSTDAIVVLGDWNPNRWPRGDDAPLTLAERKPVRLANALERVGAEVVWHDEWTSCSHCYRAMRTQADSYSWTLFGAFLEDGYVCADCLRENPDWYLDDFINNPDKAITWLSADDITNLGFRPWGEFENGWHPGQDDEPDAINDSIHDAHPDADVLFLIDDVGQFDIHFSAWFKLDADD